MKKIVVIGILKGLQSAEEGRYDINTQARGR